MDKQINTGTNRNTKVNEEATRTRKKDQQLTLEHNKMNHLVRQTLQIETAACSNNKLQTTKQQQFLRQHIILHLA